MKANLPWQPNFFFYSTIEQTKAKNIQNLKSNNLSVHNRHCLIDGVRDVTQNRESAEKQPDVGSNPSLQVLQCPPGDLNQFTHSDSTHTILHLIRQSKEWQKGVQTATVHKSEITYGTFSFSSYLLF